eukprot:Platyproteum_vivax@DN6622_c0_g1_i1.p1
MGQSPVHCPGMPVLFPLSFEQRYQLGDHLGTGRFAEVYACYDKANDNKKYAMKIIQAPDQQMLVRVREEISILRMLQNHDGVVKLIDYTECELQRGGHEVRVVIELCEGGELYERVQKKTCYTEKECKVLIRNLLEAVAYIHSKGVMHRDIKPENILLVSKHDPTTVKISDFGLARKASRGLPRSRSICGSDFYLAPEVIKQEEYGREIDIWSIGVVAYVCLSGALPFYHTVLHKLYRQIVERDISFPSAQWGHVSRGGQDFILRMLQTSSSDRLTAEQALQHPWLRSIGSPMGSFSSSTKPPAKASNSTSTTVDADPPKESRPKQKISPAHSTQSPPRNGSPPHQRQQQQMQQKQQQPQQQQWDSWGYQQNQQRGQNAQQQWVMPYGNANNYQQYHNPMY